MIWGLFALIVIFGIVSAVAFLQGKEPEIPSEDGLNAADFDIEES